METALQVKTLCIILTVPLIHELVYCKVSEPNDYNYTLGEVDSTTSVHSSRQKDAPWTVEQQEFPNTATRPYLTTSDYSDLAVTDGTILLFILRSLGQTNEFIKNDRKTQLYIKSFEDSFQRYVVTKQLEHCPYVSLCNFSLKEIVLFHEGFEYPCCYKTCDCDISTCSKTSSCCSDIHLSHLDDKRPGIQSCIPSTLETESFRADGIVAIATCPPWSRHLWTAKCINDYTSDIKTILDATPCMNHTGHVYRNKYCAFCNGESEDTLQFFNLTTNGMYEPGGIPRTDADLIKAVLVDSMYVIRFVSDQGIISRCRQVIAKCNITGRWQVYNETLEQACLSYKSEITHDKEDLRFQNVFCAMCNGMGIPTLMCTSQERHPGTVFSFSGLLNPNLKLQSDTSVYREDGNSRKCNINEFFNIITQHCSPLECSELHKLQDGKCQPVILEVSNIALRLHLRMIPLRGLIVNTTEQYARNIHDAVKNMLPAEVRTHACSGRMLSGALSPRSRTNIASNNTQGGSMLSASVTYMEQQYQMYFSKSINPHSMLSRIIEHVHNKTIHIYVDGSSNSFTLRVVENLSSDERISEFMQGIVYREMIDNSHNTTIPIHYQKIQPFCRHDEYVYNTGMALDLAKANAHILARITTTEPFWRVNINGTLTLFSNLNNKTMDGDIDITPGVKSPYVVDSIMYHIVNDSTLLLCLEAYKGYVKHFGLGINDKNSQKSGINHTELLMSIVCSSLSIACLSSTFLVYCLLPNLRQGIPGKNTMSLVAMLLIANIFYLLSSVGRFEQGSVVCKTLAIILHFFWLSSIFWMSVCSFHMFKVFASGTLVRHVASSSVFIRYHMCTALLASGFVAGTILMSTYVNDSFGYGDAICYISSTSLTLYMFGIPVFVAIVFNFVLFAVVTISIATTTKVEQNVHTRRRDGLILVKLSTLTGFMWLVGLINLWVKSPELNYVFTLLNASQGLFLFVAFIVNRRVKDMLSQWFNCFVKPNVRSSD